MTNTSASTQQFDVIIIGAGISGIGAACTLQRECPDKTFAIIEKRQNLGGTWDLFKYPGIRSDSDMYTFGYDFRPWNSPKVLADGADIKQYVTDTAKEYAIEQAIHYNTGIETANWDSNSKRWYLTAATAAGETRQYDCQFLLLCTGYYDFNQGYMPQFPGADNFAGDLIHPQHWPEDLDYADKNVVVIGSGATAVTLVPAMADTAQHVTMLQRSPTYIMSLPEKDHLTSALAKALPDEWVYRLARRRNIRIQRTLYTLCRRYPKTMRRWILAGVRKALGKELVAQGYMRHFTPAYDPWDERLCVVPEGNLFKCLQTGSASIVTDHIEQFDADGIQLKSGQHLPADIIVSATGLNLAPLGGIQLSVDNERRHSHEAMTYKGVLIQNAPNFAAVFGHTNTPWTLKAGLAAQYFCRLLNRMDEQDKTVFVAEDHDNNLIPDASIMDSMQSGYVERGADNLPRQGRALPWKVLNHYYRDKKMLLNQPINDDVLQLS